MKRTVDIVVSATLLTILAPLMVVVAIAVRIKLGSPIFFRQMRPGLHAQCFELIKFRTMLEGTGPDAERLTRFGRRLRSTSLDELPELWNVLRGDMSLVGPRPLLEHYLDLYDERQATRHRVRPGLTGLAQVQGRNELDWARRLELDAVYAESHDARMDISIMAETIRVVLSREGVSAQGEATNRLFSGESLSQDNNPSHQAPAMARE